MKLILLSQYTRMSVVYIINLKDVLVWWPQKQREEIIRPEQKYEHHVEDQMEQKRHRLKIN